MMSGPPLDRFERMFLLPLDRMMTVRRSGAPRPQTGRTPFGLAAALAVSFLAAPALGQSSDRPGPAQPERLGSDEPIVEERPAPDNGAPENGPNRLPVENGDDLVTIAWDDVGVKETFPWIARMTGKVVMPVNILALGSKKFTLLTDAPVPRSKALDLLFQAFRLNGVGVIERDDVVIVGVLEEISQLAFYPIIQANESVIGRDDTGSLVLKMFQLKKVKADEVLELITATELPGHATVSADPNSNQILV